MKKVISLLLCAVMFFALPSCSGQSGGEGTVTLKWLVPGDSQPDLTNVMEKVNAITEKEIGVKIDLQFIDSGAYAERLRMNMASQENFDLCYVNTNSYEDAVKKGGLMDIKSVMEKQNSILLTEVPDYAWQAATIKDGIYAVPNVQIFATQDGIVIRKDLADKYKLDTGSISKMQDIEPFLAAVKKGESDVYPIRTFALSAFYTDAYELNRPTITGTSRDGNNTVLAYTDQPEFWEAAEIVRDWYNNGYIRSDAATVTDDTSDYLAGKYAVYKTVIKPGVEAEEEAKLGRDLIIVPIGKPYVTTKSISATMTAISATCKHPEKALKFLELVNTNKELYNLLCYGIEGTHYKTLENGHIRQIDGSGYAPNASWKFGCQFNALLLENQQDGVWEETERLNNESEHSSLLGLTIDTSEIRTEVAQCLAIYSEYDTVLVSGSEDPNTFKETMISRLETAGMSKVVENISNQVQEFLNSKEG